MKIQRFPLIAVAFLAPFVLIVSLASMSSSAPALSHAAASDGLYPAGAALIPMGNGQPQLRYAYQNLFSAVYAGKPVAWTAAASSYGGTSFPPGTMVALQGISGYFTRITTDGTFTVTRAQVLRPARIAVFYSNVRDTAHQVVTWEEAAFETLFRVYLWGDYFHTISETAIISGALSNYDILILPSITIGYADEVAAALGVRGRAAIAEWVRAGGTLYAQGDGCYLAEAAGLVPTGTVNLRERLTDRPPFDNIAHLRLDDADHPLTFSWLAPETYILDDPVLTAADDLTVVATYTDTTKPNTPAILFARRGAGQVILTNAHPSDRQATYPLVFAALFMGMSERAGLTGAARQEFSPDVPDDIVPAYEPGVPVRVLNDLRNYWDAELSAVTITETVRPGFTVNISDVSPAPLTFTTSSTAGTMIVWQTALVSPGLTTFEYVARTLTNTLARGQATISQAEAVYTDPLTEQPRRLTRPPVTVRAKMAARLNGDRDIELDGWYPLPAQGIYYDLAGTLENKEETEAHHVVVTDIIALLSPLVDVDDQTQLTRVVTDVTGGGSEGETLWALNEIFFYNTPVPIYPLPLIPTLSGSITASVGITYGLSYANTVYTYTGSFTTTPGLTNSVTIPTAYSDVIRLTPEGIVLPALKLVYHLGTYPGYDYEDPAWRYGLFTRELFGRQVSHISDPMFDQGVIASGFGCSVFTNLGGHPIPYHEYLSHTIISIPKGDEMPRVAYEDIWRRPYTLELRTVFYDIVPFPPPEYHAVVNTTFGMYADFDRDGRRTDFVLQFPANKNIPTDLRLMLKSYSNFDPTMPPLRKDETLIAQAMFKGLGYTLEPRYGTWWNSWSFRNLQHKGPTATELITIVNAPAYTSLYFQQELDSRRYEVIDITATLRSLWQVHKEGTFKTNDGARFVYHQKAVGPNRYEVFDSHVQAVFGLSSDVLVSKQVAPVRVATYEDRVYHLIKIEDPYEPRRLDYEPFIQSYGFGDLAATVSVGGRHAGQLLFPRVQPGGRTQIRIEINNNTGVTWTNFVITPTAPAGITVTLRPTVETRAIEPLFFDFPFLHQTTVRDAWKTVWYLDVEIAAPFPGRRGVVYPISFTVSADGLNRPDLVPPARIGLEDESGNVRDIYGQAVNVQLADALPPWVTLRDVRLANAAEMTALANAINYDVAHPGSNTAGSLFETLRSGIITHVITSPTGTYFTFTLPAYAQIMPWQDGEELARTLYVILRSDIAVNWSGTAIADYAPAITYTDPFSQVYRATGGLRTVEAHGAVLGIGYRVKNVTGRWGYWSAGQPIPANVRSDVLVEGTLVNGGDDIAASLRITCVLPADVRPVSANPAWYTVTTNAVVWRLGDLGPGARRTLQLTLAVTPTSSEIGTQRPLVHGTVGQFVNIYAQRIMTTPLGDQLTIGVRGHRLYLPLVLRNFTYAPNLVVHRITATTDSLQVAIKNLGPAPVTDEFWVDAYIAPRIVPTAVNQIWNWVGDQGLVWGVVSSTLPLAPGDILTLTFGDAYYWPTLSVVTWPLSIDTPIYVQVDSAHANTTFGGVLETHEITGEPYDNIAGPVYPTAHVQTRAWQAASVPGRAQRPLLLRQR